MSVSEQDESELDGIRTTVDKERLFIIVDECKNNDKEYKEAFEFAYRNRLFEKYAPLYLHDHNQLAGKFYPHFTTISGSIGNIPAGLYMWLLRKKAVFVSHEELGVK